MTAHVAEAGEDRGRVVLQLSASGRLSETAVDAAVRVAEAFHSGMESLFVEDVGLFETSQYSFAKVAPVSGGVAFAQSASDLEHELRGTARHMQSLVADRARRDGIPLRCRTMRDGVDACLVAACAESGPWNVVALAEPLGRQRADTIGNLLETVHGMTGVVIVGAGAQRTTGQVVAVVEETDRVPGLLRSARRLSVATRGRVVLLVAASGPIEAGWLESHVRLALGDDAHSQTAIAIASDTDPRALAARIAELSAGFVIAPFGGVALPSGRELATLANSLACPILLVR